MSKLKIFLCSLEKLDEECTGRLSELEKLYEDHFVSFSELLKFKEDLPEELRNPRKLKMVKIRALLKFDLEKYRKYQKLDKCLNHREKLNLDFIKKKQQETFEIEGNKLDPQQIAAVVACEDAELILASAGSGKSASLLAKVNYLIKEQKIPAENILVIAFTRKVVQELNERTHGSGVEICTFHSFGNKIIRASAGGEGLKLIPEDGLEKIIDKILKTWTKRGVLKEKFLKEFGGMESFSKLVKSTLQLQKNEQISLEEFAARIAAMKDEEEREKAEKFYKYYAKIYEMYEKYLREKKLYDFSDMLSRATELILAGGDLPYQYILVDEVQDLSRSKSLLLQAILDRCPGAKLFAVGDDWQSIYRFAGSNLGVLNDFEKTFRRRTYRGVIRLTYRFGQPTAWVSEYFIRRNPHQSKKRVQTYKKTKTPIEVCLGSSPRGSEASAGYGASTGYAGKVPAGDGASTAYAGKVPADYAAVDGKLAELYYKMGEELFSKRVQVISRYNRDLYRLVDAVRGEYQNAKIVEEREDGVILNWWIEAAGRNLEMAFCSMHKSKGITRDIVFVINMNTGEKGMPSTRADDPILGVMLAKPDPYPLAEERRLFYVAITRATERTVMVCDKGKISPFVKEIAKNLGGKTAEIVL